MTRYWLTPIVSYSPLILGAARISIPADSDFEVFRQMAANQHPRLLAMFKASLLLSDDEDVCGSELVELDLTLEEDLVFNGEPLHLSHCAEAFLDRLLTNKESSLLLSVMEEEASSLEGPSKVWLNQWREWLDAGYNIVLLREDGC